MQFIHIEYSCKEIVTTTILHLVACVPLTLQFGNNIDNNIDND